MRIQHNIMAMNSYRNFNNNTSALSANLEKLSSGYRINRAGDDAAGLAISEKMRAQITGLDAAQKNVNDGISLVKTAEGALQEVQDMLNRMVYLAEQSANGTYDNDVDRAALQEEVNALMTEIDRIADSSNFNGTKLLNGELAGAKVTHTAGTNTTTPASAGTKASVTITGDLTKVLENGKKFTVKEGANTFVEVTGDGTKTLATLLGAASVTGFTYSNGVFTQGTAAAKDLGAITFTTDSNGAVVAGDYTGAEVDGVAASAESHTGTAAKTEIDFTGLVGTDVIGGTLKIDGTTYEFVETAGTAAAGNTEVVVAKNADASAIATALKGKITAAPTGYTTGGTGAVVSFTETTTNDGTVSADLVVEQKNLGGLNLQIGDTSDSYNQLNISVDSMKCASILTNQKVDISTQSAAKAEIDQIKASINTVSAQRGKLGAIQNRLEHTAKNLSVMEENIQNAESTIRDTDIADEMTAYTKNNILLQSAQAMLAQANQVPQGVLQLLQ